MGVLLGRLTAMGELRNVEGSSCPARKSSAALGG
jgi:hypothetical protein